MTIALRFDKVSKRYSLGGRQSLRNAIGSMVDNLFGRSDDNSHNFWALHEVSFEVEKGQALGVIGPNGAGKTTTLKLLSNITRPTSGRIVKNGRISSLIELGAGFHPELSGRENIYLNAAILGMKRAEVDQRFDSIVAFSGLEKFIDTPVKRYSSGMYVRLGFSVAAHMDPDILVIDEVLAVGDAEFKNKCLKRIREVRDVGTTIVFVSHGLHHVRVLCDQVLLLHKGKTVAYGQADDVIAEYLSNPVFQSNLQDTYNSKDLGNTLDFSETTSTKEAELTRVQLLDGQGRERDEFGTGEELMVRIEYNVHQRIEHPSFTIAFYSIDGTLHAGHSTVLDDLSIEYIEGAGVIEVEFPSLGLTPGRFELSVAIADRDALSTYDWHQRAYTLKIKALKKTQGLFWLPHIWTLNGEKLQ